MAVIDNVTGEVSYLAPGQSVSASFGQVTLVETDGVYSVSINGEIVYSLANNAVSCGVVVRNDTGTVGAASQFSMITTFDGVFVNRI